MSTPSTPPEEGADDPRRETVDAREDIQSARVREIRSARERVQDIRLETQRMQNKSPGYTAADANSEYLSAIQELILVLEPEYRRTGACGEYWKADAGKPLAVLSRPPVSPERVLETQPELYATDGRPTVANPEDLERETVVEIRSLLELLELEAARIPFSVPVNVSDTRRGGGTRIYRGAVVLDRPTLDRARRWCLAFCEEIGMGLDKSDSKPLEV